eukprot:SAG31_NODE_1036_length_10221_cov_170.602326_12_plen_203_part_00
MPRSDHLTLLKAYDGWTKAERQNAGRVFCTTHYLSSPTLRMISQSKKQYIELLLEIGFLDPKHLKGQLHDDGKGGKGKSRSRGRRGATFQGPVGGNWYNINAGYSAVIRAVICAGLYPNLVKVEPPPPMLRRDGTRRPPRAPKLKNRQVSRRLSKICNCEARRVKSVPLRTSLSTRTSLTVCLLACMCLNDHPPFPFFFSGW